MFYCDNVEKAVEYARKGVAKKVHITEEGNKVFSSIVYDEEKNTLEVIEGTTISCICNAIGIHEDTVIEFIVVDKNTIIATLLEGSYYVRDVHGRCVQVDTDGNTVLYDANTSKKKIYWFGENELERFVKYKLNKVYNVPIDKDDVPFTYLYNLRFILKLSYNDNRTLIVNCEMVEETLGRTNLPVCEMQQTETLKGKGKGKSKVKTAEPDDDEDEDEDLGYLVEDEELEEVDELIEDDTDDDDY